MAAGESTKKTINTLGEFEQLRERKGITIPALKSYSYKGEEGKSDLFRSTTNIPKDSLSFFCKLTNANEGRPNKKPYPFCLKGILEINKDDGARYGTDATLRPPAREIAL